MNKNNIHCIQQGIYIDFQHATMSSTDKINCAVQCWKHFLP